MVSEEQHGRVSLWAGCFHPFVQQERIHVLDPGVGTDLVEHDLGPQKTVAGIPQAAKRVPLGLNRIASIW